MRISSGTIYDSGVASMQRQTEKLFQTQQQISSGRRILTPADDPVAAARVLEVSQSQSINQQYGTNGGTAGDILAAEESALGGITALLQGVRDMTVNAGDAALSQADRASLAADLRGRYQELLGLANSTDGSGQYLFSGYQGGTRPFTQSAPGVVAYNGDQGQRLMQIGPARQVAVSDAGSEVFQRIASGNGTFVVAAAAGNSGAAVVDSGTVLDASKWNAAANSKDLSIKFAVTVGVTTYDIVDNATGKSLLTAANAGVPPYPRLYTSGSGIDINTLAGSAEPAFDYGARLSIAGAPANGDSIKLTAGVNQDLFKTIDDLANVLATSSGGAVLTNGLMTAQRNLDNALENVITVRASVGSRLKELDTVNSSVADRNLQYSETLSRLQDLDYAKAVSDLTQLQVNLQAAQKSFAKVAGLSLFDYL